MRGTQTHKYTRGIYFLIDLFMAIKKIEKYPSGIMAMHCKMWDIFIDSYTVTLSKQYG